MSGITVRVLSKEDIQAVLSLERIITITEEVFEHFGKGEVYSPPKVSLPLQDADQPGMHWINTMPAFLKYKNVVGMKWVNVTSENRSRGLPVTMGVILLNDATTGMPIGVLDGTWITHMRTGASTAIGARYFARADSKVITIVGGGAEGRSGLEAISKTFQFEQVRIVDINEVVLNDFVQEMTQKLAVSVVPFESVEEAVRESDIILLTTTAKEPLMLSEWSKPGDYVSTVSCFCDLDSNFITTSDKFLVDDKGCALHRIQTLAGIDIPDENVYGDICEVAAGKCSKRENDQEIITYTPVGMGAVDVGVALEALELAREKGVGKDVMLAQAFDPS